MGKWRLREYPLKLELLKCYEIQIVMKMNKSKN